MLLGLLACAIDSRLQPSDHEAGPSDSGKPAFDDDVLVVEVPATEPHDCLGELARAGDINGDGNNDLLVSVSHSDEGGVDAGKIMAVAGPFDDADSALENPIFAVVGHGDLLGELLADQRDLDGDGTVDLFFADGGDAYTVVGPVVGEIDVHDLQPGIQQDGDRTFYGVALGALLSADTVAAAAVFSGTNEVGVFAGPMSLGERTAAEPDLVIDGQSSAFARHLAIADATGDGCPDLLLAGDRAWVVPGPLADTAEIEDVGIVLYDGWTDVIGSAGDVDADGVEDVLTVAGAARNHQGYVRTFAGASLQVVGTWVGADPDDRIGAVGSAGGDIDGDGKGDVVIGGPENNDIRGRTWILLDAGAPGSREITDAQIILDGTNDNDSFGHAVVGPGNILGDERSDFAVTAWGYESGSGRLYVFALP